MQKKFKSSNKIKVKQLEKKKLPFHLHLHLILMRHLMKKKEHPKLKQPQ